MVRVRLKCGSVEEKNCDERMHTITKHILLTDGRGLIIYDVLSNQSASCWDDRLVVSQSSSRIEIPSVCCRSFTYIRCSVNEICILHNLLLLVSTHNIYFLSVHFFFSVAKSFFNYMNQGSTPRGWLYVYIFCVQQALFSANPQAETASVCNQRTKWTGDMGGVLTSVNLTCQNMNEVVHLLWWDIRCQIERVGGLKPLTQGLSLSAISSYESLNPVLKCVKMCVNLCHWLLTKSCGFKGLLFAVGGSGVSCGLDIDAVLSFWCQILQSVMTFAAGSNIWNKAMTEMP